MGSKPAAGGWMAWIYVGLLIGLPALNLIYRATQAGWANIGRELGKPDALHALGLTLGIALATVLIGTVMGTVLALTIVRSSGRDSRWLALLMDIPSTTSPVVAGFLLAVLYAPQGWVGTLLGRGGVTVLHTTFAMILASLFVSLPLVARQIIPLLAREATAQEEAAHTLGAEPRLTFWRITLPAIRPGLERGMLLTFARSLGEFGATIVVSGNIIGQTQTLTLWVHQEAGDFNMAGAYGASLLLGAIAIAAMVLVRRRSEFSSLA